ncbi:MAG: phytanoyl-CoA dioxygenase family protein [Acidimicrobiales bacterium]
MDGPRSPSRAITDAEVDRFWRDGVVLLPAVLDIEAVVAMRQPVDRLITAPTALADMSEMAESFGGTPEKGPGRFVSGTDHWIDDPDFAAFATRSALPAIAAALLRSSKINLYEDSVLVKEPGTAETTALHQDLAYFHVDGEQICTMWIPLDPVDRRSGAVHYLPGSHLDGRVYRPNFFVTDEAIPGTAGEPVPTVDTEQLISYDTGPGDVVVHHARTLHGATANTTNDRIRRAISLRYAGDDARYRMRPGAPRKPHHVDALSGEELDHPRCPVVWPPS